MCSASPRSPWRRARHVSDRRQDILGHGHVKGKARVFKRGCGELIYKVSGRINGERIKLYSMAPVRDSDCSIVHFRKDRLVFKKM
jgi:hypothetical protein